MYDSLEFHIKTFYKEETIFPIKITNASDDLSDQSNPNSDEWLESINKNIYKTLKINHLRILYLFSSSENIKEFLNDFLVVFSIVDKKPKKQIASCRYPLLRDYVFFAGNQLIADQHKTIVYLFVEHFERYLLDLREL